LSFTGEGLPSLTLPTSVKPPTGAKVTLGIRPEDFLVDDEGKGWPVTISVAEQHGANSYLHCTLENGEPLLLHQQGQSRVQRGDTLTIVPRPDHWHLFDADGLRIDT
jgi:ABC-type sugar transport system ATPase subunit